MRQLWLRFPLDVVERSYSRSSSFPAGWIWATAINLELKPLTGMFTLITELISGDCTEGHRVERKRSDFSSFWHHIFIADAEPPLDYTAILRDVLHAAAIVLQYGECVAPEQSEREQ